MTDRVLCQTDQGCPNGRGWLIVNGGRVERCDLCEVFASDAAAIACVDALSSVEDFVETVRTLVEYETDRIIRLARGRK